VFLAEDFVKGVEKYLSNAKVKPMERDFQRYYSIMHNSSAVDEELVGMLEERSLASN
jgi:hypothetical protein